MSELEGYHRSLTVARAHSNRWLENSLEYLDNSAFSCKTKDRFGLSTDESIARAMTLEDDKYWAKKIYLEVFTMQDSIPDPATERMFAGVMHALMEAE